MPECRAGTGVPAGVRPVVTSETWMAPSDVLVSDVFPPVASRSADHTDFGVLTAFPSISAESVPVDVMLASRSMAMAAKAISWVEL